MTRTNHPSNTFAILLTSFRALLLMVALASGETTMDAAGNGQAGICPYLESRQNGEHIEYDCEGYGYSDCKPEQEEVASDEVANRSPSAYDYDEYQYNDYCYAESADDDQCMTHSEETQDVAPIETEQEETVSDEAANESCNAYDYDGYWDAYDYSGYCHAKLSDDGHCVTHSEKTQDAALIQTEQDEVGSAEVADESPDAYDYDESADDQQDVTQSKETEDAAPIQTKHEETLSDEVANESSGAYDYDEYEYNDYCYAESADDGQGMTHSEKTQDAAPIQTEQEAVVSDEVADESPDAYDYDEHWHKYEYNPYCESADDGQGVIHWEETLVEAPITEHEETVSDETENESSNAYDYDGYCDHEEYNRRRYGGSADDEQGVTESQATEFATPRDVDADREMWRYAILSMARSLDRVSGLLHLASEELTQLAGDDLATVPADSTAH